MMKRNRASAAYTERIVRQRNIDAFWKSLHECSKQIQSEENLAGKFVRDAGITSHRKLRTEANVDITMLNDILSFVQQRLRNEEATRELEQMEITSGGSAAAVIVDLIKNVATCIIWKKLT